jgi:hypothetical protein
MMHTCEQSRRIQAPSSRTNARESTSRPPHTCKHKFIRDSNSNMQTHGKLTCTYVHVHAPAVPRQVVVVPLTYPKRRCLGPVRKQTVTVSIKTRRPTYTSTSDSRDVVTLDEPVAKPGDTCKQGAFQVRTWQLRRMCETCVCDVM